MTGASSNDDTAPAAPHAQTDVQELPDGSIAVTLAGRLDANTLPAVWENVLERLRPLAAAAVTVEGDQITYCDGAGIALLLALQATVDQAGGTLRFRGLAPALKRLVELATPDDFGQLEPPRKRESIAVASGRRTAGVLVDLQTLVTFVGELLVATLLALRHPLQIRWKDLWQVAEKSGVNALPVVMLLGWLIGLIIAFQTAGPMKQFGAETFIPNIVGVAMVRELGPLITAIILAGRSGSAFAAELGTMKVTEELDALTTLGLEPVRFLVVPRVLAAMLMTPLLSVFGTLMGVLGGFLVMHSLDYSFEMYTNAIVNQVTYVDLLGGVFKTTVFALIIAAIGCLRGLQTKTGPGAVGDATTRAVVSGIVLLVVADGILGLMFYSIGI